MNVLRAMLLSGGAEISIPPLEIPSFEGIHSPYHGWNNPAANCRWCWTNGSFVGIDFDSY